MGYYAKDLQELLVYDKHTILVCYKPMALFLYLPNSFTILLDITIICLELSRAKIVQPPPKKIFLKGIMSMGYEFYFNNNGKFRKVISGQTSVMSTMK